MSRYDNTTTNPLVVLNYSCTMDFTSPGCCGYTIPTGVQRITFEIWGGGGGGGAKCCCDCYHNGVGGSGGGYSRKTVSGTLAGCVYTVCVGYGGMQNCTGSCTLHWCCYGQQGGTTYVTGYGLSNFCATGGDGGQNSCYYNCGCHLDTAGCGFGGDFNACGGTGQLGAGYVGCMLMIGFGAGSAFTNNGQQFTSDACCRCMIGYWGTYPGGGGGGAVANACCCCSQAGVGANGMVRILF